jgi:hypothetical protein
MVARTNALKRSIIGLTERRAAGNSQQEGRKFYCSRASQVYARCATTDRAVLVRIAIRAGRSASERARSRLPKSPREGGCYRATMRARYRVLAAATLAAALGPAPVRAEPAAPAGRAAANGAHDFDFLFGEWRVHHRVMRPTLDWYEFDGTCRNRGLVDGSANVEEHLFKRPTGDSYGIALRAYDPKSGDWSIWWVDGRNPSGTLEPPVRGRFAKGVGTFYSDGSLDGKPMRVRYIWSRTSPRSARWEQAYSFDAGKTWQTNWIMELRRAT